MTATTTGKSRAGILVAVVLISVAAIVHHGPIVQDAGYHSFADQRTLFGVPNALNVLSNVPFVLVGGTGAVFLALLMKRGGRVAALTAYFLFFLGVAWTGCGSAYYHWHPTNGTLVWDRLPMTVVFMSFFSSVVSERINGRLGAALLFPLLVLGAGSVLSWAAGDRSGSGDLRMYAAVQYVPLIMIPVVLLLYRSPRSYWVPIVFLLACYGAAKACELFDGEIYSAFGSAVSGHTLKHLFGALGTYGVLKMVRDRRTEFLNPSPPPRQQRR